MSEKVQYRYSVEITPQVLFLMYLSYIYKIDLESLLLLYDRIGEDVFFVFFLFAGKNIIMPKQSKIFKIRSYVEQIMNHLETGEQIDGKTKQNDGFLAFIKSIFDENTGKITVEFEIPVHKTEGGGVLSLQEKGEKEE